MKKILLSIMIVLLSQTQCYRGDDDLLSIQLTPYTGNQLQIDGYYYQIGYDDQTIFSAYFFYKNGVLIYCGGAEPSLEEMDNYIKKFFINSKHNKYMKYDCGLFLIEGNNIKFDRWYPSEKPYKAFVREGVIINDTTFHITKSYHSAGITEPRDRDEMYYFRSFSPKPDSTNVIIK